METREIRARFVNGVFVPLSSVSFKEGDIIEIEVVSGEGAGFSWRGALKKIGKDSVEVQHGIKDEW